MLGPRGSQRGFSLLEALIALAVLAIGVLFTLALYLQEPKIERRLAAHDEAVRLLGAVAEELRAGAFTPPSGEHVVPRGDLPWEPAHFELLDVRSTRETTAWRNLSEVELQVRYRLGPQIFEQHVMTQVFWP